jgi:hypothetical protein
MIMVYVVVTEVHTVTAKRPFLSLTSSSATAAGVWTTGTVSDRDPLSAEAAGNLPIIWLLIGHAPGHENLFILCLKVQSPYNNFTLIVHPKTFIGVDPRSICCAVAS